MTPADRAAEAQTEREREASFTLADEMDVASERYRAWLDEQLIATVAFRRGLECRYCGGPLDLAADRAVQYHTTVADAMSCFIRAEEIAD